MARTGIEEGARRERMSPEDFRRRAEERVPIGRFIAPQEVARLALFLASDQGSGITGQSINLDRKSTRLNSSHLVISDAVFCFKKKKKPETRKPHTDNN